MQRARAPCIPAACSRAGSRQPARPRTLAAAGQGASSSATTSACTVRGQRPCVCMRVCACVRVGVVETVAINWRHHETTTSTSRERERERDQASCRTSSSSSPAGVASHWIRTHSCTRDRSIARPRASSYAIARRTMHNMPGQPA